MFGLGFMEIFVIAIIAVIALGPDKLPDTMVQIAKFFRKFKAGLDDAKSTLDNELNVSEMKDQANKFKAQIEDMKTSVSNESKIDLGLDDIMKDDLKSESKPNTASPYVENTQVDKIRIDREEKVSFKKKQEEVTSQDMLNSDKFKVNFDEDSNNQKIDVKKEENV